MGMDLVSPDQKGLASFWQRKEGNWGLGVIAVSAIAGIIGLKLFGAAILAALATATAIVGSTIMLFGLLATLFVLLWITFATPLPKLLSFWFKASVRRLAGVFVAVYPVEIIREFVSKMKTKQIEFKKGKEKISGAKKQVEASKKEVEGEKAQAMSALKYARDKGNNLEMNLQSQIIMQSDETLQKYLLPSLAQLDLLYERLGRLDTVIDYKIRGMENQAKNLERQNATSKITRSTLASAWAILRGSDPEQEMYDMAVDHIINDYQETMGMVDDFMNSTEEVLNGFDMKTGQWRDEALAQLAELENKEQLLIAKTPEAKGMSPSIIEVAAVPVPVSNVASKYLG